MRVTEHSVVIALYREAEVRALTPRRNEELQLRLGRSDAETCRRHHLLHHRRPQNRLLMFARTVQEVFLLLEVSIIPDMEKGILQ
jgi:hypothetical protein